MSNIHDLLTAVESLNEQGHFVGSTDRLYSIVESCAQSRPVSCNITSSKARENGFSVPLFHR